jgi:hypothetical protein
VCVCVCVFVFVASAYGMHVSGMCARVIVWFVCDTFVWHCACCALHIASSVVRCCVHRIACAARRIAFMCCKPSVVCAANATCCALCVEYCVSCHGRTLGSVAPVGRYAHARPTRCSLLAHPAHHAATPCAHHATDNIWHATMLRCAHVAPRKRDEQAERKELAQSHEQASAMSDGHLRRGMGAPRPCHRTRHRPRRASTARRLCRRPHAPLTARSEPRATCSTEHMPYKSPLQVQSPRH